MREQDYIDWIRRQGGLDPARVPVGPGDDCAVVRLGSESLLVTVDQVLDGVHVRLAEHGPRAAGRKAMARNLSDIAAMAGLPLAAVVSAALPSGFSRADAEALYRGLREIGDAFACPIVGGDLSAWDHPLAISVTVWGQPAGIAPVLRSGASAGDAICVTGQLGGAWTSRRHLEFVPRIREARVLAARYAPHAMIDLSDGLATDLRHLCAESNLGAEVLADAVPVHPDARASDDVAAPGHAGDAGPALAAALSDGEDYELLFALPADRCEQLLRDQPLGVSVTRIGTMVEAAAGLVLVRGDGGREPLHPTGWEHHT